jgi:hypothetical protein
VHGHHQSRGAGDDPHAAHRHDHHPGTDEDQTNDADDHHHHENADDDHHHDDAVHGRHQIRGAACVRHHRHHAEVDVPDVCHHHAQTMMDAEIDCCPKDADLDDALP